MWLRIIYWIAILLFLVGAAPVLMGLFAMAVGSMADCNLNEGSVTPCVIGGVDFGETLTFMLVFTWMTMLSWPIAAAGIVLFIIALLLSLIRRLMSRRQE